MSDKLTRLDYCQYLLVSQVNYTLTHFAQYSGEWSHDAINRFLQQERITPRLIWENVRAQVDADEYGYLLFDAKQVIKGIGVVSCVYVNPNTDHSWLIDYRVYAPDGDGKSKLDHVSDMLNNAVHHKQLPFHAVLMDTWYATKSLLLLIESLKKAYYCPLKSNRLVDDSGGMHSYQHVDSLQWHEPELQQGKVIKIKGFHKDHKVKLFRVVASSRRTDYIVTNDWTQDSTEATQEVCGFRWKIEQLHREGKQTTGWEKCQCRRGRIQRNHIACALLVWVRLHQLALQTGRTLYQLKQGLLDNYLIEQLKYPSIKMVLA